MAPAVPGNSHVLRFARQEDGILEFPEGGLVADIGDDGAGIIPVLLLVCEFLHHGREAVPGRVVPFELQGSRVAAIVVIEVEQGRCVCFLPLFRVVPEHGSTLAGTVSFLGENRAVIGKLPVVRARRTRNLLLQSRPASLWR